MNFLANPCYLWHSEQYEHKRAVLRLTFAGTLIYARNKGFRTAPIAQRFRLLEGLNMGKYEMVPEAGLEPAIPYGRRLLKPLCMPISPLRPVKWLLCDSLQHSQADYFPGGKGFARLDYILYLPHELPVTSPGSTASNEKKDKESV